MDETLRDPLGREGLAVRKSWETLQDFAEYRTLVVDRASPRFGQLLTYGRAYAENAGDTLTDDLTLYEYRVFRLRVRWNFKRTDRILVLGCGFGFLIDVFRKEGFPNVFGLENSPWIWDNMKREKDPATVIVRADIRQRSLGPLHRQLRKFTGGCYFDWVLTEGVLESYEDEELPLLLDRSEVFLNPVHPEVRVIHMVAVNRDLDPVYNLKTPAEWEAVRPTHSWIA